MIQKLLRDATEYTSARIAHGLAHRAMASIFPSGSQRSLRHFGVAASRLAYFSATRPWIAGIGEIARSPKNPFFEHHIGWERFESELKAHQSDASLSTSLILKEPGPNAEPGVLYVSFEYNWLRLLSYGDWETILKDYVLVGASSWSPTNFGLLASLVGRSPHPIFIGISNPADIAAYSVLGPQIVPLPILACDWVDPSLYTPRTKDDRDIDILMVAHWGRFKRHELLFSALSKLPPTYRVVLVGRDTEGRTADSMQAMARALGARQHLEFFTRIPNREVAALQARAKVALNFSAREGSCVAITEAMAADTPVGVIEGAHIGATAHINPSTGVFLKRRALYRQLGEFVDDHAKYSPRQWLAQHASALQSNARLEAILANHPLLANTWTQGLAPMRWVYVPSYIRSQDRQRLSAVAQGFPEKYGITLIEYPESPGEIG